MDVGTEQLILRRSDEIDYERVEAANGLKKGILLNEELHGMPNFAMRKFVLEPGASVPKHTNNVEHEQYVLSGKYTVGIGDNEFVVSPGDSLFIPAGVVHWYRNESAEAGAFICVVPNGEDEIILAE